ncbi:MAG: MucB/RseB C-terminal domain-containing protein, partial [Gammaproteobacteria bacterium]|nr:MucB/RseB C-terminal domain-containing protein [Gammaproteobacteria bacterium]
PLEGKSETETFRIYHRSINGESSERLVGMDGDGFEVIRNSAETVCIFPGQKSVVIEKRSSGSKSPLAAGLPAYSEAMEGYYRFEIVADDRTAGRSAKVLRIAAADSYRYGYKIWLDTQTAMPLKSQLRSADDSMLLEEVMFADIRLQEEVGEDLVSSAYDTEGFSKMMPDNDKVVDAEASEILWNADDLPVAFKLSDVRFEYMADAVEPRLHLIYTDGLASVSVFVDQAGPNQTEGSATMGATHAFTVMVEDYMVTAVGQVPLETVQKIANGMDYRSGL